VNNKIVIFTIFKYIATIINSIKGFFIAAILEPVTFGFWTITMSIVGYFRYSNFGVSAFIYYRANLSCYTNKYKDYLYLSFVRITIPISIIFTIYYYFLVDVFIEESKFLYLSIFSFSIVLQQVYITNITRLKIERKMSEVASLDVKYSLLSFVLYILLTYYFDIQGLFVAFLFSLIIVNFIVFKGLNPKILHRNVDFHSKKFRTFIKNSVVTIFPSVVYYLFIYLDLWLISYYYGLEYAGYFGIYLSFMNLVILAPSSISTYMYSMFSREIKSNINSALKVATVNFIVSLIIAIIGYQMLEFLVSNYLEKYTESLLLINILLFSLPFLSIRNILGNFFIANKKTLFHNMGTILFILIKFFVFLILSNYTNYINALFYINVAYGFLTLVTALYIKRNILNETYCRN